LFKCGSDAAEFGVGASGGNYSGSRAGDNAGTGEDDIGKAREVGVFGGEGAGLFGDREGLSGEGGLVGKKVVAVEDNSVGGDKVTGFEGDDVARDNVVGRYGLGSTAADNSGASGDFGFEFGGGLGGFVLLEEVEGGGENYHEGDQEGVDVLTGGDGDNGHQKEDYDQRVFVVFEVFDGKVGFVLFDQAVVAVGVEVLFGLWVRKTGEMRTELFEELFLR